MKHRYTNYRNWTNQKQILPISLESFKINSSLLQAPKTLREFVNQYKEKRNLIGNQEKKIKIQNSKSFILALSQMYWYLWQHFNSSY